ncbi:hypothetical protein GCM10010869_09010 [Mesorhizobium tianshanense]|nr:hypothetical protein GCM10010869_09010 [Mesorhizobium tianshanense]
MLLPGTLRPKHVVEKKALAVPRCETVKAKAWPVHQYFSQPGDLGMHT